MIIPREISRPCIEKCVVGIYMKFQKPLDYFTCCLTLPRLQIIKGGGGGGGGGGGISKQRTHHLTCVHELRCIPVISREICSGILKMWNLISGQYIVSYSTITLAVADLASFSANVIGTGFEEIRCRYRVHGHILLTEIMIKTWMCNYIQVKLCDVITHPYRNFNSGLVKPPLK